MKDSHKSYCIISDYLQHDKHAVYTFLQALISDVKASFPNVLSMNIYSDGAASQFKQRFILSSLNHIKSANDLERLEWNFFASSHGKGAVDGVGGSVKRLVWRLVKARKETVATAEDFFQVAKRHSKTTILQVNVPEVTKNRAFLDQHWETVRGVPGLQKVHHVVAAGNDSINYSTVAMMPSKTHRFSVAKASRLTANDVLDELV